MTRMTTMIKQLKVRLFPSLLLILSASMISSCNLNENPSSVDGFTNDLCFQNALMSGTIFKMDGRLWLRAGEQEDQRFDITGWSLRPCQVNLGYGREHYAALIDPAYVKVSDNEEEYPDDHRVIILDSDNGPRIYPIDLLNIHILVNDEVDGNPVMIYYSIFTDMPAVYRRDYCDTVFTFAVSGYTYWDYSIQDATNDFLLWDRETESLWWPLINKAVSSQMKGNWMVLYNESRWRVTTWKEVREGFPDADVLEKDQTLVPPTGWPRYFEVSCK